MYFCISVKNRKQSYNFWQRLSSCFMILALVWLTVSIPFVNAAQQQVTGKVALASHETQDDDQSCNPYGNNTEEKCSSSFNSFSEEYLHHTDDLFHAAELFLSHSRFHSVSEYVAFHGEMLCPPPNFIS